MADVGELPNSLLLSIYGGLAGLNDMKVEHPNETRDEARCRFAKMIVERGLLDGGCTCDSCQAIRMDAALAAL